MNILQVIMPLGIGGAEKVCAILKYNITHLQGKMFLAIGGSYYEEFLRHFDFIDAKDVFCFDDKNIFRTLCELKKIIKECNPDVIHTHARRECFLICLLKGKMKHIRTQHMQEMNKIPVCFIEKRLLKSRVDLWIATSEQLKKDYLLKCSYISKENVATIYNGVQNKNKLCKKNDKYKYCYCIVSRITRQKGIDLLLNELISVDKWILERIRIDIYGIGEELENILRLIKMNNLEDVITYKGEARHPLDLFEKYDALLMPSRYEGLPLTLIEAMSAATPVAIHNVGCVKEFIENKFNGWIIDDGYSWNDFFGERMSDNDDLQAICNNARNTYLNIFTEQRMCTEYWNQYIYLSGESH